MFRGFRKATPGCNRLMAIMRYAAKYSAFNPIEQFWARLSIIIIVASLFSVDNLQSRIYIYSKNSSVLANLSQLS